MVLRYNSRLAVTVSVSNAELLDYNDLSQHTCMYDVVCYIGYMHIKIYLQAFQQDDQIFHEGLQPNEMLSQPSC